MLTATDIKGVYAITPTPAKEGAERWDATDTVDLDEDVAREVLLAVVDFARLHALVRHPEAHAGMIKQGPVDAAEIHFFQQRRRIRRVPHRRARHLPPGGRRIV